MKAMIFAAGLGTRLRPITDTVPKAMVEVGGQPILKIILDRFHQFGMTDVIVNVHYLPDIIIAFLNNYHREGMNVSISDERNEVLETGGGLLKAQGFFEDGQAFLVANADVLTNIHIDAFLAAHKKQGGIATLAVRDRVSKRKLLFDEQNRLLGRDDESLKGQAFAFSGYHIIEPEIFNHITRKGKFSITDWYIDICKNQAIYAFQHQEDIWVDIGTQGKLELANQIYLENKALF
ncbi:MAG: nucleotidyltransferase family protein [Chitinophagales bacterium]|nr:nucleotidyltransferase family protein [Chitinophagales bacterium]